MKKVYYYCIACFIAGITIGIIGGYNTGHQESMWDESHTASYEAACLMGDFIHYHMDEDPELEESFYEWFQDLDMGTYNTQYIKDIQELNSYSWSY